MNNDAAKNTRSFDYEGLSEDQVEIVNAGGSKRAFVDPRYWDHRGKRRYRDLYHWLGATHLCE